MVVIGVVVDDDDNVVDDDDDDVAVVVFVTVEESSDVVVVMVFIWLLKFVDNDGEDLICVDVVVVVCCGKTDVVAMTVSKDGEGIIVVVVDDVGGVFVLFSG